MSGYGGRKAAPRRRGGGPGFRLPRLSLGWLSTPLLLLAAAGFVVAGVLMFVFIVVPFVTTAAISAFGLTFAAFPVAVAAGAFRWWRLGGGRALLRAHWRHLLGGLLLFTAAAGLLALLRPDQHLLGVSLAEVSVGGLFGQAIAGEPELARGARIGLPMLAGAVLVYPALLTLAGRGLLFAGAYLVSLRLPQRAGSAAVTGVRAGIRRVRTARAALPAWDGPIDDADDALPAEPAPEAPAPRGVTVQGALLPIIEQPGEEAVEPYQPSAFERWELPPIDLLEQVDDLEVVDQTQRAKQIEDALASYGVDAKVSQIHVGPAVTQFGLEPGWDVKYREVRERDVLGKMKIDKSGNPVVHTEEVSRIRVKVERITSLSNNLALALAAPSVRIEAPVPGKNVVGIEVPNTVAGTVSLRSVIESPAYQRLRARAKLALALGKGVAGDTVVADLAKMPHLLIAGATGSGKSVCINTVICSIIMHASPDDVRFLMVDPKRVEMAAYNNIPHLLCPVIVDPERVVGTLQFVIREMEERYRKFAAIGVRNIEGFNKSPRAAEYLPYWVLVIDELADLMMVAPYEVEKSLCRLAQLARATGIHLVVATQRPSVDVITGLIKANFPTRISFAVSSQIDSRTILDASGAEKLLGRGDMLYVPTDANKPKRVQGAYVSDAEVETLTAYWGDERFRELRPRQFQEEMEQAIAAASADGVPDDDPLLEKARELAASSERVSTSFLQRRLRVGYPRAARLMETLRDEGYGDDGDDGEF